MTTIVETFVRKGTVSWGWIDWVRQHITTKENTSIAMPPKPSVSHQCSASRGQNRKGSVRLSLDRRTSRPTGIPLTFLSWTHSREEWITGIILDKSPLVYIKGGSPTQSRAV
jgi:hypothetical protein